MIKIHQQDALAVLQIMVVMAGLLPALANAWYLLKVAALAFTGMASGWQLALAAHGLCFLVFAFRWISAWGLQGSERRAGISVTLALGGLLVLSSLITAGIAGNYFFLTQPDPLAMFTDWAYLLVFFLSLCTIKAVVVALVSLSIRWPADGVQSYRADQLDLTVRD